MPFFVTWYIINCEEIYLFVYNKSSLLSQLFIFKNNCRQLWFYFWGMFSQSYIQLALCVRSYISVKINRIWAIVTVNRLKSNLAVLLASTYILRLHFNLMKIPNVVTNKAAICEQIPIKIGNWVSAKICKIDR